MVLFSTYAWEQRKVGEWGNFYYGHSCPKWSVTEDATTPCIRYGEMYTKFGCKIDRVYSYTNIPKENLKFSKGTEVLVPRVGEDPMDYNHCTWLSLANVAIGEMISVYNTEQNPLFTAIMFNATLKYEFAKRVEGGSVTNLYYEKLLEIPVSFPIIEEQKKIASFFENLDTLITLHQRKKKRTHEEWMSSLLVEEVRHEEEQPVCEKCDSDMKEIGEEKVYDELVYTPAKFHVRRHIAKKYKCVNCGEHPESSTEPCRIRLAEYPKPMIPHSFCSPALLAHVVYEKYVKGIPLHRQEKDFISKGIPLSKATLSSWVGIAAQQWGLPIVQEMHKRLLVLNIIHSDETTVQVLHEEGRKPTTVSRMWVYANGKMNDYSIIIFEYQPTRGGEHPAAFLKDFHGYLICDGYDAYNAVTGAKRCGCWMHTRRYFVEALPKDKSAYETSVAAKAVEFCNRIYHEEGLLAELTPEERYEQRLVKVKPLLDASSHGLRNKMSVEKGNSPKPSTML